MAQVKSLYRASCGLGLAVESIVCVLNVKCITDLVDRMAGFMKWIIPLLIAVAAAAEDIPVSWQ